MKKKTNRIVAITGGSSGIGLATAKMFAGSGDTVFCLSRTPAPDASIIHVPCDVGDNQSVKNAFDIVREKAGRIDVLVLSAGFGISGAAETTAEKDMIAQFDINFFGAVRCINHGTDLIRQAKGHVVFLGSLAAVVPIPFQAFYSARKAAVCNLSRAYKNEVRPFGIRVAAVLPGDVNTGFTDRRKKNVRTEQQGALYGKAEDKAVAVMEKDERTGMTPQSIARVIFKVAGKKRPRPYYTAGGFNKFVLLFSRLFCPRFVDFVVRKIYLK